MKKYLILLLITFMTITFSLISCDQESDVGGSEQPDSPKPKVTLNVTVDVTIDTRIEELADKTLDDINKIKLYYGIGSYDENTPISSYFETDLGQLKVEKTNDTNGAVTFTIKDDKLSLVGNLSPYFMLEILDNDNNILANMENVYTANEEYEKGKSYNITLSADSIYNVINIAVSTE